jgi:hypothetical protein
MLPSKAFRMSIWLRLFAPLLVLRPGLGFVTGSSFSGSLERVGNGSISIRLADHRVIDAMLGSVPPLDATSVVAQYSMGDQVEVTCKPIQPVWEEATSRYQSLQVTAIRLIRRPSPEELSKILAVVPFQEGKNLLKRPGASPVSPPIQVADLNAPGGRELAHARLVNLEYAANMPNFVADETAKRYRSGPGSSIWRDFDTIESEITFRGNHAVRQRIRRNGKTWDQPFEALPGFKWYEGFGTEIRPLFDPKCPTTLDYQGRSKEHGRLILDYRFTTPVDGCFPFFFFGYQRYNPPRTGHVSIDDPAGNIIQLDEDASGFPAEIEFAEREEHISWDYVEVGEESHLLPIRANFLVRYYDGTRYRIDAEFKNHRHFEASSNISFQ